MLKGQTILLGILCVKGRLSYSGFFVFSSLLLPSGKNRQIRNL